MNDRSQVAERSLFLWNNEYIVSLVAQHRHAVLPLVFPALERNARSHWNPAVHGLTVNVRASLASKATTAERNLSARIGRSAT